MGTPALWVGFLAVVVVLVGIDLRAVAVRGGTVTARGAAVWVAVWVSLSMGFAGLVHHLAGPGASVPFLTAYVMEYALSVDNLFVFLVIFAYFKVRPAAQHRLLYWGVLGAVVLRATLITLGTTLVARFHWLLYFFGAFLLFTAWKLLFTGESEEQVDPEHNVVLRWARKLLPVSQGEHGVKFVVREGGRLLVTPLFLILLVVETTDVIFAFDSIPAVLGISQDAYVVFTSNVCAILGLRSLFFVVSALMDRFHHLKLALGFILAFVGFKLVAGTWFAAELAPWDHWLTVGSLVFVVLCLGAAIAASMLWPPTHASPTPIERE